MFLRFSAVFGRHLLRTKLSRCMTISALVSLSKSYIAWQVATEDLEGLVGEGGRLRFF